MVNTATNTGLIVQIIGPVVDVEFSSGQLPKIYNAISIGEGDSAVVCEVQQLLGNNRVRAVSMTSTDGLKRGMTALPSGNRVDAALFGAGETGQGGFINIPVACSGFHTSVEMHWFLGVLRDSA